MNFPDIDEDVLVLDQTDTEEKESKRLIIWNDDVNSFQHVIICLMKYCGHELHQAEQLAIMIDGVGKASVKTGDEKVLKPICEALCDNGLSAEIQ